MKTSDRGIAEIFSHEAAVSRRYKDSVGVWTVGIGHTKAAGGIDPATITKDLPLADLIAIFRADLPKYEAGVNKAVKVPLAQHEYDALVSFHFNTGAIGKASFVKKLNAGDRDGAAAGMMAWSKPKEIIERRKKEQRLFRDGVYSNDGKVTVYPASDRGAVQWSKGKRVSVREIMGEVGVAEPVKKLTGAIDYTQAEIIEDVQQSLKDFGYFEVGGVDGLWGGRTRGALLAYRADRGLPLVAEIDRKLLDDMISAAASGWSRVSTKERVELTKADIPQSATIRTSWWGKLLTALGLGGGVAGNAVKEALTPDRIEQSLSYTQRVIEFTSENWPILVGVAFAGGAAWASFRLIDYLRVKAQRDGRHFGD